MMLIRAFALVVTAGVCTQAVRCADVCVSAKSHFQLKYFLLPCSLDDEAKSWKLTGSIAEELLFTLGIDCLPVKLILHLKQADQTFSRKMLDLSISMTNLAAKRMSWISSAWQNIVAQLPSKPMKKYMPRL